MKKFREGDYVEMLVDCSAVNKGQILRLEKGSDGLLWAGGVDYEGGSGCSCRHKWKFVKKAVKFKVGDKVAVIECASIKVWQGWTQVIDKIYTLNEEQAGLLNRNIGTPLGDNEGMINFLPEALEIIGREKK